MKKAYINPAVEVIKIDTATILAASSPSLQINSEYEVDSSADGVQQGREDRPSNPNLWDQAW